MASFDFAQDAIPSFCRGMAIQVLPSKFFHSLAIYVIWRDDKRKAAAKVNVAADVEQKFLFDC